MLKTNRVKLIVTTLVMLLPMLLGLLLWERLPDTLATHFGADNMPDGWSSKGFVVFGMPLILLALHWFCVLVTAADPKRRGIEGKPFGIVLWICPTVSLIACGMVYAAALEWPVNSGMVGCLLIGTMFLVIGNYLPKCRQNYTMGIKLPWTLHDEENWNRTHRLAGPLWMAAGAVFLINAFLQWVWLMIAVLGLVLIIPAAYSYILYRRGKNT